MALLISIAGLIPGCATGGDYCAVASAIRPSVHDTLTTGTKQQILTHNTVGARLCGWKAGSNS